VSIDGVSQQVPAPRFSRTPGHISVSPTEASRHDAGALLAWGFSAQEIEQLKAVSAIE
jgi:crotonobetainyl-CoA:carnitine CoA-transferase CaiB-like acyl-CoA transferase